MLHVLVELLFPLKLRPHSIHQDLRGVTGDNVDEAQLAGLAAGDSLLKTHELGVEAALECHKAQRVRLLDLCEIIT